MTFSVSTRAYYLYCTLHSACDDLYVTCTALLPNLHEMDNNFMILKLLFTRAVIICICM